MRFTPVRLPPFRRLLPGAPRAGLWWATTALLARVAVVAPLSTTTPCPAKQMPPRPRPPPEDEFEEVFLKGSGPGGQKINKTNSAVQLRHKATGIVVKSQATRSRSQNRSIARQLLAARLDELNNGANSRTAIVGAVKQRRAASAAKKTRRKYRRLEEEKAAAVAAAQPNEEPAHTVEGERHDTKEPDAVGRDPGEQGPKPDVAAEDRHTAEKPMLKSTAQQGNK